jgi:hypothetical protein
MSFWIPRGRQAEEEELSDCVIVSLSYLQEAATARQWRNDSMAQ